MLLKSALEDIDSVMLMQGHHRWRSVAEKMSVRRDSHASTGILTDRALARRTNPEEHKQYAENADIRLDAESIAKVSSTQRDRRASSRTNTCDSPTSI